jgi:ATP-binding cassette subfamily F protein uup
MNILTINELSKSYNEKVLFKNISLTINEGDKIGLLGSNGSGKSTLLKIINGLVDADNGHVNIVKNKKIAYLSQNPEYNKSLTVIDQILQGDSPIINVVKSYENIVRKLEEKPNDKDLQKKFLEITNQMDRLEAWEIESQVKTVLTKLGIHNFDDQMEILSGGQRKRVFLAQSLLSDADLLILDEPTNHMDNEVISWLENYLLNSKQALLMVTHDRYFLDRVVNKIVELDYKNLYTFTGNYSTYLKEKSEIESIRNAQVEKRQKLYKSELEWIRAGVQGRGTKQKARIDRFETLEEKVNQSNSKENLSIDVAYSRLGKKVIHIEDLYKSYDDLDLIKGFSTIISNNERIGIIGPNGIGKSTLLEIIMNPNIADRGSVDIGSTVKFGYYAQGFEAMDENLRVIEYIKNVAEYVETKDGRTVSAGQMLENFLFPSDLQWSLIEKLSGGEKRRLYLLKTLMLSPNVLILDEPTNDLDIDTLNILEDYLEYFQGTVISVSHDRYFLDKTCHELLCFQGQGKIFKYTGNYSDYESYKKRLDREKELTTLNASSNNNTQSNAGNKNRKKKSNKIKLTYHEKIEFDSIESEIEILENKLDHVINEISKQTSDFVKLQTLTNEKDALEDELLEKMERFEYLSEKDEKSRT